MVLVVQRWSRSIHRRTIRRFIGGVCSSATCPGRGDFPRVKNKIHIEKWANTLKRVDGIPIWVALNSVGACESRATNTSACVILKVARCFCLGDSIRFCGLSSIHRPRVPSWKRIDPLLLCPPAESLRGRAIDSDCRSTKREEVKRKGGQLNVPTGNATFSAASCRCILKMISFAAKFLNTSNPILPPDSRPFNCLVDELRWQRMQCNHYKWVNRSRRTNRWKIALWRFVAFDWIQWAKYCRGVSARGRRCIHNGVKFSVALFRSLSVLFPILVIARETRCSWLCCTRNSFSILRVSKGIRRRVLISVLRYLIELPFSFSLYIPYNLTPETTSLPLISTFFIARIFNPHPVRYIITSIFTSWCN